MLATPRRVFSQEHPDAQAWRTGQLKDDARLQDTPSIPSLASALPSPSHLPPPPSGINRLHQPPCHTC